MGRALLRSFVFCIKAFGRRQCEGGTGWALLAKKILGFREHRIRQVGPAAAELAVVRIRTSMADFAPIEDGSRDGKVCRREVLYVSRRSTAG